MRVEVGQIVNTHGIKGEIKSKIQFRLYRRSFLTRSMLLTVVHITITTLEYTVKSHRVHKGLHML